MEKNKKKATEWVARGRGGLRKLFQFYALFGSIFLCAYV